MTIDDDFAQQSRGREAADDVEGDAAEGEAVDTVMAAGPASGAAGVAHAELGTSGPPAEAIMTPEELAQTEIDGGAGLRPEAIDHDRLAEYFGQTPGDEETT